MINLHYGTRLQKAKLIKIMAKIIVNYDKFVIIPVVEWDQQDWNHIPGLNRHVLVQITLFLMDLMMLIWWLTSLIDHSSFKQMITCVPFTVIQEGWQSQGTGWNQTLNYIWVNELINWNWKLNLNNLTWFLWFYDL